MKFGELKIENFLSIGSATVNLSDRGLLLIEGVNLDDPAAKSNGAGKSTIVDALSWVLYGQTARGIKNDEVVNRHVKKNCLVSVQIYCNGFHFEVLRTRKHKTLGSSLYVKRFSDGLGALAGLTDVDLTKGTMAETQKVVEEIIGCPYQVFVSAIYAGQDAMPDIPAMTDKQLKTLIESVIGVEELNASYEEVKTRALENDRELTLLRGELTSVQNRLEINKSGHIALVEKRDSREISRKESVERFADLIRKAEVSREVQAANSENREEATRQHKRRLTELDEKIGQIEEMRRALEPLQNEFRQLETEVRIQQVAFDRARADAQAAVDSVRSINDKVGTKCSECGKVYTVDDLENAKEIATKNAKKAVEYAQTVKTKLNDFKNELAQKSKDLETKKAAIPDVSILNREKQRLIEEFTSSIGKEVVVDYDTIIAQYTSQKTREENEVNVYEELIQNSLNEKTEIEKKIAQLNEKVLESENRRNVLSQLKNVFGPTGVRAHILDTVTPVLNDRTARYLDVLSDGKLSAVWTTLTTTKKGEIKEQFNVEVKNTVGGGSFESLSGGEKRKVRVACCLALQEIVASRAKKPIDLFIADEVDHALDEAGVERLIGLLQEKANHCGTLLVISHNPLRNWIDNTITIKKENGVSSLS